MLKGVTAATSPCSTGASSPFLEASVPGEPGGSASDASRGYFLRHPTTHTSATTRAGSDAAIAVLLSLSGIYAVLSFTVSRRTREIGVRVALGASPRRVVAAIFRRPLTHVTLGVLTGGALIAFMAFLVAGGDGGLGRVEGGFSLLNVALLLAYAALMLGVCLLACVARTWRALNVEPTVALRAD
jgi:ABC-type antimicrobial peptide transport system permease subunit